jgi:hypothetical protein
VDPAARIGELGRQPRATRQFFDKYQGRILFGTDAIPHGDDYPQQVYGDSLYRICPTGPSRRCITRTHPECWDSRLNEEVGQVVNLRPIVNRPTGRGLTATSQVEKEDRSQ